MYFQHQNLFSEAMALVNSMNLKEVSHRKPCLSVEYPVSCPSIPAREMSTDANNQEQYFDALFSLYNQTIKQNDIRQRKYCSKLSEDSTAGIGSASLFEGNRALDVAYYLKRISLYSEASPSCLITSLIYLERAQHLCPPLRLTSRTLQRLLLVAVMTATKYLEDTCCLNSRWAEIGGLSVKELNALEREFLSCLQYRLVVHPDEYAQCTARLAGVAPWQGPDGGGRASRRMSGGGTSPLQTMPVECGGAAGAVGAGGGQCAV